MQNKPHMLRHKETGELFIWTPLYAKMAELEEIPQSLITEVAKELEATEVTPEAPAVAPSTELNDLLDNVIVAADIPAITVEGPKPKKSHKKTGAK